MTTTTTSDAPTSDAGELVEIAAKLRELGELATSIEQQCDSIKGRIERLEAALDADEAKVAS